MGALMKWLNSRPADEQATKHHSLDDIRQRTLDLLADCERPQDQRIRTQLQRASNAQQLWQARCDIYQAIAHRHCEAEAVRRLNALASAFEGWLPPAALTRL